MTCPTMETTTRHALALALAFGMAAVPAQAQMATSGDPALADALERTPVTLDLAGGSLRVVNLFRLQADALRATAGQPADSTVARLVRDVYAPHTAFWNGYLGDEGAFRRWAVKLLAPEHPIHARLPALLGVGLDRRFVEGVEWIERTTGRRPEGTWYIVFGPGWTDMGGLSGIGMVADFSRMQPDSAALAAILPHELTHQVHGTAAAADPDAGTVLHRIVAEGFATYVAWVHGAGERTPARALGYSDEEWRWALAHERELYDAVRPILGSTERSLVDRVASRGESLIDGAPGAGGYFIGFRIVEGFVARHGPDSWQRIYDMPVADVLAGSLSAAALPYGSGSPAPARR